MPKGPETAFPGRPKAHLGGVGELGAVDDVVEQFEAHLKQVEQGSDMNRAGVGHE